jgi:exo-beta-1,3-glucanase (GH17 family)
LTDKNGIELITGKTINTDNNGAINIDIGAKKGMIFKFENRGEIVKISDLMNENAIIFFETENMKDAIKEMLMRPMMPNV